MAVLIKHNKNNSGRSDLRETWCGIQQCTEPAVIHLYYAGRSLCKAHFVRMFDKRFRKTVRQYSMLQKGDRVAVGLSGGKDSLVLLHSLAALKKDLPFELLAITIDEGIAGYRAKTLVAAKRECRRLRVPLKIVSFKSMCKKTLDTLVKENQKKSDYSKNPKPQKNQKNQEHSEYSSTPPPSPTLPCSLCGVIRRYALNHAARSVGANKLAIGHNLDDLAQTALMNIMRNEPSRLARLMLRGHNSGGRGVNAGINVGINAGVNAPADVGFVPRIRPLMLSPEKEIAIYAMLKGIKVARIECPYAHTAFRGHVRKMLNESEEKYPGTKFRVMNCFLDMEDALQLKYCTAHCRQYRSCNCCGEPCSADKPYGQVRGAPGGVCMFCKMVGLLR